MTTKEIQQAFQCETWKASRVRRILDGQLGIRVEDYHSLRLYHSDDLYSRLLACDELLDCTFGVEGLAYRNLSYLNTGDPYDITICLLGGKFFLSSWGDFIKSAENN